jgi:hypothetical protein
MDFGRRTWPRYQDTTLQLETLAAQGVRSREDLAEFSLCRAAGHPGLGYHLEEGGQCNLSRKATLVQIGATRP